jgi:DNA-binding XRE family transcriptional regulator
MGRGMENQRRIKGWNDDTRLFLSLPDSERAYIELRLALATSLRDHRKMLRMTQVELAGMLNSSQSRVAKMEAGDPTVSLDLLIRGLLALGASNMELARVMTYARLIARRCRS